MASPSVLQAPAPVELTPILQRGRAKQCGQLTGFVNILNSCMLQAPAPVELTPIPQGAEPDDVDSILAAADALIAASLGLANKQQVR